MTVNQNFQWKPGTEPSFTLEKVNDQAYITIEGTFKTREAAYAFAEWLREKYFDVVGWADNNLPESEPT